MISVVIAAHNEEHVIGRTLSALLEDAEPAEFDVVVVCNGCTDATETVARRFEPRVRVFTTPVASKVDALNLGDGEARAFPRFYLDADIPLRAGDLRELALALERGDGHAVSAERSIELDGRPRLVKGYYRIWEQLPQVQGGVVGSGVYGISEAGRQRFGEFPPVLGDDYFVQQVFAPDEQVRVARVRTVIEAPYTSRALVGRKARVFVGNRQVGLATGTGGGDRWAWAGVILRSPNLAPFLPAFLLITLLAKMQAAYRRRTGTTSRWSADSTTRTSRA